MLVMVVQMAMGGGSGEATWGRGVRMTRVSMTTRGHGDEAGVHDVSEGEDVEVEYNEWRDMTWERRVGCE